MDCEEKIQGISTEIEEMWELVGNIYAPYPAMIVILCDAMQSGIDSDDINICEDKLFFVCNLNSVVGGVIDEWEQSDELMPDGIEDHYDKIVSYCTE